MEFGVKDYGYSKIYHGGMTAYFMNMRVLVNEGGTGSGKTFGVMQMLDHLAQDYKSNEIITVGGVSRTSLTMGAVRDFQNIKKTEGTWDESCWNDGRVCKYRYRNGNVIEFVGMQSEEAMSGPKRWLTYITEALFIEKNVYDAVDKRTKDMIILDWNPKFKEHYMYDLVDHHCKIGSGYLYRSTYLDNKWMPEKQRKAIELMRDMDPNWWRIFGQGLRGSEAGFVFPDVYMYDSVPVGCRLLGYGLDFGYTIDPTALVGIWYDDKLCRYYYELLHYESTLDVQVLLLALGRCIPKSKMGFRIVADGGAGGLSFISALRQKGYNCSPARKFSGSIVAGIALMKEADATGSRALHLVGQPFKVESERYVYAYDYVTQSYDITRPSEDYNHAFDAARMARMDLGVSGFAGGLGVQVV